jgi:hypothetical protein
MPNVRPDTDSIEIVVTNLSQERLFRNVRLVITADTGVWFGPAPMLPFPADVDAGVQISSTGRFAWMELPTLQPGWTFIVPAVAPRATTFDVRARSDSDALYFVKPSWRTAVVRNEIPILVGLAALWALGLAVYAVLFGKVE